MCPVECHLRTEYVLFLVWFNSSPGGPIIEATGD